MTTYSEAVCHTGQHKDIVYTMLIQRHVRTHTKRSDMDHTVLPANYTMPAFCPASVHQITTLLSEVEGI